VFVGGVSVGKWRVVRYLVENLRRTVVLGLSCRPYGGRTDALHPILWWKTGVFPKKKG
jgi:hypothetical protein